ncbi:MAG: CdaR family protein [Lachnospiraceae bacterium]|nr:CdaR family protein [Lachnospiraceae bacterium]
MKNNRILANPGLRVASLVIAFGVWLMIMNLSNPVKIKTFSSVAVNVTNSSYVESMGLSYKLPNGSRTVNVTVNATRSTLERLTSSGISVTADLTQIVDLNADPVMVPLTVSIPGVSQDNISANPKNIEISLEDMISQDFVINPTAGDTTPGKGYEIGKISVEPEKLTLRGPKSLIDKIDRVVGQIDVTGLKSDSTMGGTVKIYDKNGDVLDESQMNYLTATPGYDEIMFDVVLYQVLSDVPITAETYGTPAAGYQAGDITVTPSTIKLVGDANALAVFRENGGKIVITEDSLAVDISEATVDQDINVQITDYIPSDLRLAADLSDRVVVSVKILEQDTKLIEIETRAIEQKNVADNLNAVFNDTKLEIRIKGTEESLETLSAEDIQASVDFTDLQPGEMTLPVEIELPDGCSLASDVMADITLAKQEVVSVSENNE